MSAFGNLLKSYRQERNFTQKELADTCVPSFTEHYIFLLESGRKLAPPEKSVLNIAQALSLSKREKEKLVDVAKSDRLSHVFVKNDKIGVDSVVRCLATHFNKEEMIKIANGLEKMATVN